MKHLMDYIMSDKPTHEYTIKMAFEPQDKHIKHINHVLNKYDPIVIGDVERTIFQNKPIDFPDLDCGEIYIIKVELQRGAQHDIMSAELANKLKVPQSVIKFLNTNSVDSIDPEDIVFDEYLPKLIDKDYSDAKEINVDDLMGDKLSDIVSKEAVNSYNKNGTPYSNYMIAGYEEFNQTKRDTVEKSSPTKG